MASGRKKNNVKKPELEREVGSKQDDLEYHYYNLSVPSAYAGGHQLVRTTSKKLDNHTIAEWLDSQDAYNLHKLVRHRFPRRNYHVFSPFEVWEADLADFRSLKTYNDGYAYILVVIDALSRFA